MNLEPLSIIKCRINIRPEYEGRKANPRLAPWNGLTMGMRVMFQMDETDKYPGEYALVPADKKEWDEMSEVTGWIASGDVEILEKLWTR